MKRKPNPTSPPADPATHDREALEQPSMPCPRCDGTILWEKCATAGCQRPQNLRAADVVLPAGPRDHATTAAAARNGDAAGRTANGDALAAAGIRPWCRGLLILLSHPHHLKLANIIDLVAAAADSGGLTQTEAALLTEVRAGAVAKEHQHMQRIAQ